LVFAAVLGVVCATLLTAVGQWTRLARELNEEADWKKNVLVVLAPGYDTDVSAEQVLADFDRMIPRGQEAWGELKVYRYEVDGKLVAMAVPFTGAGVWGKIEGYLALEGDLETIRGIVFTRQAETPGLGAEIVSEAFRGGWREKKITAAGGIVVCKGPTAEAGNEVDGITGATRTGNAVRDMVNVVIEKILLQRQADWKKNVLALLKPGYDTDVSAEQVLEDFEEMIPRGQEAWGKELQVYRYEVDGELMAMAVPFSGPGVRGDIEGYLALEGNLETIRGILFARQKETPGLGGEIVSEAFRRGWRGKKITAAGGIVVCKGPTAEADNEVDGITGAAGTGDAVGKMVNAVIVKILAQRTRDKEAGHGG